MQSIVRSRAHDFMFVDAGSSGSKVFTFTPEKSKATFYTECREDLAKPGMLHGLAALSYSQAECEWQVGTNSRQMESLEGGTEHYAERLLTVLVDTYKTASKKKDLSDVVGSQNVSILATAGMRLISQATNDRIWGQVCGQAGSELAFAARGEHCGTIPGTTEAYYEYLANAVHGSSRALTGTFTVGGASAQIAIPLRTDEDVVAFENLRSKVMGMLDCTALKLDDGQAAPIFNTKREGGAQKECIDDYVTFRPTSAIHARKSTLEEHIRVGDIKGLGLVSFLGLEGRGSFVAGGVNQIQSWAEQVGCAGNETSYAACLQKLRNALAQDIMWSSVTEYFRNNAYNIEHFSYNTYGAVPEQAGLEHVSGRDQGWELEAEVAATCEQDNSARFGYKNSNSCMRALYTSLYVTSFFHGSDLIGDDDGPGQKAHDLSKLHFNPKRDWAEGIQEEMAAGASFLQLAAGRLVRQVHRLLRTPLSRHSTTYLDGYRIHHESDP